MKDLARNPLGIIALFISLIYAFANMLLGATVQSLDKDERFPLIMFIVFFPIIVLGVFYLLVSRHHGKLYAPGDYKDDSSFLRTLSPEERDRKLQQEAEEVAAAVSQDEGSDSHEEPIAEVNVSTESAYGEREEEKGFSRLKKRNFSYIRSDIQFVENEVIKRIESEFNAEASRDIGIGDTGASFDAFFNLKSGFVFLEVRLVRSAHSLNLALDRILYNAVVADKYMGSKFKLIVAIVYELESDDLSKLKEVWQRRVAHCPASLDVRFIRRDDLNK